MPLQRQTDAMKKIFFHKGALTVLWCLGQCTGMLAQQGYIKGKVSYGNEPLHAATVSLGNKTLATDHKGNFFLALDTGRYSLHITHAGYTGIEETVSVFAGDTQFLHYALAANEQLDDVVILGSRSLTHRSTGNTPVPVDVFTASGLVQSGQVSLTQMLNFVAPSFNASREILNEPATLRGLDPDHVLILVNGTRYHNMAWLFQGSLKGQLGRGSVGNDLNSIPFSAIEKIEVLRDGASAQYGSDAIAGVINIRLKTSTGKTSMRLHTGQFYAGDGGKFSIGINGGIPLPAGRNNPGAKNGFLNLSADFRSQASTFRGGSYEGTVYYKIPTGAPPAQQDLIIALDNQKIKDRGFNRKIPIDNAGNSEFMSAGFLINGGYPIHKKTEIYWTAIINQRKVMRQMNYRFPKNTEQVNAALYPDGFQPRSKPNTVDLTLMGGIKGETDHNWRWQSTSAYGSNSLSAHVSNTNNASQSYLGILAPTSFYTGRNLYTQVTQDVNFAKAFRHLPGRMKSLNLAWGVEGRWENLRIKQGEEASWKNYDSTGKTQAGAGGISPGDAMNKNRHALGSYLDLESQLTNRLLVDVAARLEQYSDFGSNSAAKLSTRYDISEQFAFRASVSNGFRAPSLQQRYSQSLMQALSNVAGVLVPAYRGIFPNDHEVTKALGIPSLTAEKSVHLSAGLTARFLHHISLTVDAYWIRIKDRIVLSGVFERKKNTALDSILAYYPTLKTIDQVAFFTNAINTRTHGLDIVVNSNWNIHASSLRITLAANLNATKIFGVVQSAASLPQDSLNTNTLFNRTERGSMEKGQPYDKIILHLHYQKGKLGCVITNTRFGKTATLNETYVALDEHFPPKVLTDISFIYSPRSFLSVTIGANNLLNVYPKRIQHYENTIQGSQLYSPAASPFGFNGGYYFLGMNFNW
jgi:iron complex outermembrane recepter protein